MQRTAENQTKFYNARAEPLFCSLNLLFYHVLVAVTVVVVCLKSGSVLRYMGSIGICGPKEYGFSAVLVINRVSIIAILPPLW